MDAAWGADACAALANATEGGIPALFLWRRAADGALTLERDLTQSAAWLAARDGESTVGVGLLDAGSRANVPAWPLRNVLVLMARVAQCDALAVLCVRERFAGGQRSVGASMLLHVENLGGAKLAAIGADQQGKFVHLHFFFRSIVCFAQCRLFDSRMSIVCFAQCRLFDSLMSIVYYAQYRLFVSLMSIVCLCSECKWLGTR